MILALVALLGACAGAEPTATLAPTPTPTLAPGAPAPTPTPRPSPTPTPTPRVVMVATPTPTATPGAVAPTVREPKGSVTVAWAAFATDANSPDRRFSPSGSDAVFQSLAFEYLVGVTPEHQLVSMLAESWESPDNGHTWVFKLRKGVKFHNGKEMSAEDVAATFNSYMKVGRGSSGTWSKANLNPYEVVDKYTVRTSFKQEGVRMFLPAYLGRSSWFAGVVSPKEMFEKYPDKPWPASEAIGTGPYRLAELVRGEKVRLVALDPRTDWVQWRIIPAFKEIIVKPVAEDGTRIAILKTSAAALIDVPTSLKGEVSGYTLARADAGATLAVSNHEGMDNPPDGWWTKKEFRMALNLAVDKQAVADFIFNGEAKVTPAYHFYPGAEGFDPDLKPYPYDPARARQLLKDINYDFNYVFNVWLYKWSGVPEQREFGTAVAAMWERELGIKTKLIPSDTSSYPLFQNHDPQTVGQFFASRSTSFPDLSVPIMTFSVSAGLKGQHRNTPWHGKGLTDDLTVELAAAVDPAERSRIARQIERVLYDEYVHVQGWAVNVLFAYNPKQIKEFKPLQGSTYMNFLEYLEPPS
ncbi:MAG: ABC transporter substrate-binding protein [Chloroflexi bacterium]|nr:ABC transporter substrate-binding protein [Chloroflexota bacterium]